MIEQPIYEENYKGLGIKIFQDNNCESPNDWYDEGLFLVGWHRDFTVEREKFITKDMAIDLSRVKSNDMEITESDYREEILEINHKYWYFGLEAYIHGGVALALSNEGNFVDRRWDVSQLGLVFVAKKEFRLRKSAMKKAKGLIETWNDYLSNNVYGFLVCDSEDNCLESCWGFYGDYDKSGILDEAKNSADIIQNNKIIAHINKVKAYIRNKVPLQNRQPLMGI